jgi:sortase A
MSRSGRKPLRGYASTILIAIGLILLGYAGAQYGRMYWAQRQLAQQWQRQSQVKILPGDSDVVGGSNAPEPASEDASGDASLIRLRIPSISLDSMVVAGTSSEALELGPGRMTSTPIPGDPGNAVISGHRDTFFRHIHELKNGDEILVQRARHTYRFQVTGKKIVQPTDVWVLNSTKDSELTLITCYPTYYVGPAPKRLVVFSRLEMQEQEASTSP